MPPLRLPNDADAHKRCGTVERLLHLPQLTAWLDSLTLSPAPKLAGSAERVEL